MHFSQMTKSANKMCDFQSLIRLWLLHILLTYSRQMMEMLEKQGLPLPGQMSNK